MLGVAVGMRQVTLPRLDLAARERVDSNPGKRRISAAGLNKVLQRRRYHGEGHEQFTRPQLLTLTSEFHVDRWPRNILADSKEVADRFKLDAVHLIPVLGVPGERQGRILPLTIWTELGVWGDDDTFPGGALLHSVQKRCHMREIEGAVALAGYLDVLELQHGCVMGR